MQSTIKWTFESSRPADPLYQRYLNRAEIRDEAGTYIGEILLLDEGVYQPRVPGLMGANKRTEEQAHDEVVRMHLKFRN